MSKSHIKTVPVEVKNIKSSRSSSVSLNEKQLLKKSNLINPEQANYNIGMLSAFQANKQYLMDKVKIAEIPRPSKYYHKIPSKTPGTTYNKEFHKSDTNFMNQLKLERKDNLYNSKCNVGPYQTLYHQNFSDSKSKSVVQSLRKQYIAKPESTQQKRVYQPNEAPTFLDTSYSLTFVKKQNSVPTQSAKRNSFKLMGGGAFKGQSTYNGVFKNVSQKKQHLIYHPNNKIFMQMERINETTYNKQFNTIHNSPKKQKKEVKKSQSSLINANKQKMGVTAQMKQLKSEYERSFQTIQPQSHKSKNVSLMTLQQMKKLILNAL